MIDELEIQNLISKFGKEHNQLIREAIKSLHNRTLRDPGKLEAYIRQIIAGRNKEIEKGE